MQLVERVGNSIRPGTSTVPGAKPSGALPASSDAEQAAARLALDAPLTREEALELKRHLLFLRDYKRVLKLKVNAQEDLLLNGAREPSSRGVCHHLLQKVDYALVSTAAARLDAKERPRLLAGVLGFKSELAFLLLYLECLKEAAHDDATLALEQALERIDFSAVSEGQMRRVLELIVELFDEAQRASLMLGLLESSSFRHAFDQALSKLPEALHSVVTPVRALHAVVFKGKPNPLDGEALLRGLQWLLKNGLRGFERRPVPIRVRLIELLLTRLPEAVEQHGAAFRRLLESLDVNSRERRELEFFAIQQLLKRDQWQRATQRLAAYVDRYPGDAAALRLNEALAAPRLGPLALLQGVTRGQKPNVAPSKASGADAPGAISTKVAYLYPAALLLNQRPLWLRLAAENENTLLEQNADLQQSLLLPGIARVVVRGSFQARSYVAVPRLGEPLTAQHPALRARRSALSLLGQVAAIASALAERGLALPDLNPRRFEILQGERLVLINLWEAAELGRDAALSAALRESQRQVALARCFSEEAAATFAAAASLAGLSELLDTFAFVR